MHYLVPRVVLDAVRNGVEALRYSGVLFASDTPCVKAPNA